MADTYEEVKEIIVELLGVDEVDRLAHCGDFLSILIRDFSPEFFFECHDQFHKIEGISLKIFTKASLSRNLGFINT